MKYSQEIYKARYPKAIIADGASVAETCRVDEGVQISAEAEVGHYTALCGNTKLIGKVRLGNNVVIREDVTLIGPLEIREGTFVARGATIGSNRPDEIPPDQETLIEINCLIGKGAEIVGGVHLGERVRVRAGSHVIGDVPKYGIAARSPAILERYACPECGHGLYLKRATDAVRIMVCYSCQSAEYRFDTKPMMRKLYRVLLPNDSEGERVSILGDDLAWRNELEMI